jgi:hypothetical protein
MAKTNMQTNIHNGTNVGETNVGGTYVGATNVGGTKEKLRHLLTLLYKL